MTVVPKKAFVRKENGRDHVKSLSDQHHVINQSCAARQLEVPSALCRLLILFHPKWEVLLSTLTVTALNSSLVIDALHTGSK